MAKYCVKCGKKLADTVKFCDECGTLVGVQPSLRRRWELVFLGVIIMLVGLWFLL